jgi:hypothetical protein
MYGRFVVLSVAVGLSLIASTVLAQCGCDSTQTTYTPVVPSYATNDTPAVTYYPTTQYATYYTPATPQAAYYAPAPQPYTTYYAPVAQPYAANYAPAPQPYVPYYGTLGRRMYGTPKVYVPGEPVRNVLRAITP